MNQLRGRLTYANLMATIAVFIALGGASYAAVRLPKNSVGTKQIKKGAVTGAKIKNGAVTGAKIKNGTINGAKIKNGTITGAKIDVSTLGAVPGAVHAGAADDATHATSADDATHATSADDASHARSADSAAIASDARTLDGQSAAQIAAAGKLTCPAGTSLFGGVCFETASRGPRSLTDAMEACGEAGRFLPTVNELFSYEAATYTSSPPYEWAGQIYYDGTELVGVLVSAYSNGSGVNGAEGSLTSHPYRCVVMPTN
jgi:hypothetical protein